MAARKLQILIAFGLLFCSACAYAHSGRTDANGGHYNRKPVPGSEQGTGEYHYHNKPEQRHKQVTSCGKVIRVVDGDTFEIEIGGIITRIRFRKGDAPELGTPEGEAAKVKLASEIEGKKVCITHSNIRGYYKRLLIDRYALSN